MNHDKLALGIWKVGIIFGLVFAIFLSAFFLAPTHAQQSGKIVIIKETIPPGDPQEFEFSGDFSGTLSDGEKLEFDVSPGPYSVGEDIIGFGWEVDSIRCSDTNSEVIIPDDLEGGVVNFVVEPGETVTCTFTNLKTQVIWLTKTWDSTGIFGSFEFTGDMSGTIDTLYGEPGEPPWGALVYDRYLPGTYTVTEIVPSGWELSDITCDDADSFGSENTVVFNVEEHEHVKCTLINSYTGDGVGTIKIKKLTDGGDDTFRFELLGPGFSNHQLIYTESGMGMTAHIILDPGTYSVEELEDFLPSGWSSTGSASCTGSSTNDGSFDGSFTISGIELNEGDEIICEFNNELAPAAGTITIEKQTIPADDSTQFGFAGTDMSGFLADGESMSFNVMPGEYVIHESNKPSDWILSGITCSDDDSTAEITDEGDSGSATIRVDPNEDVTCVFENTLEEDDDSGTISIRKETNLSSRTSSSNMFTFSGDIFSGEIAGGDSVTVTVEPGEYVIHELIPDGSNWILSGITCIDSGDSFGEIIDENSLGQATINVGAKENVICTFENTYESQDTSKCINIIRPAERVEPTLPERVESEHYERAEPMFPYFPHGHVLQVYPCLSIEYQIPELVFDNQICTKRPLPNTSVPVCEPWKPCLEGIQCPEPFVRPYISIAAQEKILSMIDNNVPDQKLIDGLLDLVKTNKVTFRTIPSPMVQLDAGVSSNDIQCGLTGHQLGFQSTTRAPVCASENTFNTLLDRGWLTR